MLTSETQKANYKIKKGKDGLSSVLNSATGARQRGSILIGLIITMVIMAALGAGMVYLTSTSTFQELFANNNARAYYAAESGIRYANAHIREALKTGDIDDYTDMETDVANKTYTMANGDTFTLSIFNENTTAYPDSMMITYNSIGTVGSGFLQAKRKISYTIMPANQGSNPPGGNGGGGGPQWEFDIKSSELKNYYTPTDADETKIASEPVGLEGDNALNLKAADYTMGLKWHDNPLYPNMQLDDIRAISGHLSYGAQVKIYDYDEDTGQASSYNIIGISFRLDGHNDATTNNDFDNMYGISFVKLTKPADAPISQQNPPAWYATYIAGDSSPWNVFSSSENKGQWFVVLWQRICTSGHVDNQGNFIWDSGSYVPLKYYKILGDDSVCRESSSGGGCAKLEYWATLLVNVEETGTSPNESNLIRGYLASPDVYGRRTTVPDNRDTHPILWAEKDGEIDIVNPPTPLKPFRPISWTPVDGTAENTLTAENVNGFTVGSTTKYAREIGLHIFDISTSALNIFYDNFYIDLSPSYPPGGDFVDPDPIYEGY